MQIDLIKSLTDEIDRLELERQRVQDMADNWSPAEAHGRNYVGMAITSIAMAQHNIKHALDIEKQRISRNGH